MIIGYARVSTTDQDATLQHTALAEAGCERTFTDQALSLIHISEPTRL